MLTNDNTVWVGDRGQEVAGARSPPYHHHEPFRGEEEKAGEGENPSHSSCDCVDSVHVFSLFLSLSPCE